MNCTKCEGEVDVDERCCLECGFDMTEEIMSRAFDDWKDRMKYGDE